MELFQTAWKSGSYYTHGMTSDEFFYNQVYDAVKESIENNTLPFFNKEARNLPVEISSGKQIADENLIPLEMMASKHGFQSNIWIFGSDLEKMQKEGFSLSLKKGAEPVLCRTRYENPTHIQGQDLYMTEGSAKAPLQFLYNFDSFDDRSKKAVEKYFRNAVSLGEAQILENFRNFTENLHSVTAENTSALQTLKKNTLAITKSAAAFYESVAQDGKKINLTPLVNAQAKHMCQEATGCGIQYEENPNEKEACYKILSRMIDMTAETPHKGGKAITDALSAGISYAKSYTSKGFNREERKLREEEQIKKQNISRSSGWEY